MPRITWLASYPKSGSTWVRVLLANYLAPDEAPVDINGLPGVAAASRRVFDSYVGLKSSMLDRGTVERLRPAVYRAMARTPDLAGAVKVHDAWGRTDDGEPIFPPEATAGVIYVLRSVLDVAPSAAHHWGLSLEATVDRLGDDRFTLGGDLRLDDWLPERLGSWSRHIRSWLDASELPALVVRYEDLKADTLGELRRIVAFLGRPCDEARLARAVADDLVILNLARGNYAGLDAIGRRIWELLETPRRLGDLCQLLAEAYAGDPAVIARETTELMSELHSQGLVVLA